MPGHANRLYDPLPLPGAGDRMFGSGADEPRSRSVVWHGWTDGWYAYAAGYKLAADAAVAHACSEEYGQDILIYPVGFLYRHYLELTIKSLVRALRWLLDEPERADIGSHDIARHWAICSDLLRRVVAGDAHEELDHVGRLIGEFCGHDPKGQAFRYPEDTKGNVTLKGLKWVSLGNMRDVMDKIAGLLEGVDAMVGEYAECKAEYHAEWAAEYEDEMRACYAEDMRELYADAERDQYDPEDHGY